MQISPTGKKLLGFYLIIVGCGVIIFHKQVKQLKDDWYEHLPPIIWRGPTGALLTVTIIVSGVMSIILGIALLSVEGLFEK
jgi:hypothetical protein